MEKTIFIYIQETRILHALYNVHNVLLTADKLQYCN